MIEIAYIDILMSLTKVGESVSPPVGIDVGTGSNVCSVGEVVGSSVPSKIVGFNEGAFLCVCQKKKG